jgi:hypothetical protein
MSLSLSKLAAVALLALAPPHLADAQQASPVTLSADQLLAFAKAHLAISEVRDKLQAELADPRLKKVEDQVKLREKLRAEVASALKEHKLTSAEFDRLTLQVSSDTALRAQFEAALASLTQKKPPPPSSS